MRFAGRIRAVLRSAPLLAALALLLPSPASAQGFFDFLWGGGSREVISFSPSYQPGQLIVSFGDKRLYWIQRRGELLDAENETAASWAAVCGTSWTCHGTSRLSSFSERCPPRCRQ